MMISNIYKMMFIILKESDLMKLKQKKLKDLSASTLRNYVQNLNSSTIDSEPSRRIFELKSESESFALRTLVEKFSANAADILNGIDNDIPIENETWILWIFPTPFVGLEPEPKTYLERQMQNIFIENVPDSYFEIIKILKKRIEDADYDIFKVVEEQHLMRLRTFVKWFKNARRIQLPEALSSEEEDFRSRKTAFDSFLEVLRYSLWPTSPTHLSLRKIYFDLEILVLVETHIRHQHSRPSLISKSPYH